MSAKPRTSDVYIDDKGNKVVEPVWHGNGTVSGNVGVKK